MKEVDKMNIKGRIRLVAAIAALALIPAPAAVASGASEPVDITDPTFVGKVGLDQGVCYEWMLYGVRGSGEPALRNAGIGATLKVAHTELSRTPKFRGKLGSAFPAEYKALPVDAIANRDLADEWWFEQIVNNAHVNRGLRALALMCPDSKILLAGYSQGAIAISSSYAALAKDQSDPILKKVRGAFLVGNPARTSNRALFRQAASLCKAQPLSLAVNSALDLEFCKSSDSTNYDTLAVKTPRSKAGFRVREFFNKNDLVADFDWIRSFIGTPKTVSERVAKGYEAHSNYKSTNRDYVRALKRFGNEVR